MRTVLSKYRTPCTAVILSSTGLGSRAKRSSASDERDGLRHTPQGWRTRLRSIPFDSLPSAPGKPAVWPRTRFTWQPTRQWRFFVPHLENLGRSNVAHAIAARSRPSAEFLLHPRPPFSPADCRDCRRRIDGIAITIREGLPRGREKTLIYRRRDTRIADDVTFILLLVLDVAVNVVFLVTRSDNRDDRSRATDDFYHHFCLSPFVVVVVVSRG